MTTLNEFKEARDLSFLGKKIRRILGGLGLNTKNWNAKIYFGKGKLTLSIYEQD